MPNENGSLDERKRGGDLQSQCEQFAVENPRRSGGGGPRNRQASIGEGHQTTIAEQAETLWQTPATDSFRSRGGSDGTRWDSTSKRG